MKNKLTKEKRLFQTFLTAFVLAISMNVSAQSNTVKGTITSKGLPLPGVSVILKGTKAGTASDFDGNYSIKAKTNDVLVFSFIGYRTKEVTVKDNYLINVQLDEDVSKLDEVVVIGYGTANKKDLTGSIVSVKSEQIDQVKPVTFEGGLAARAAGVQVVQSSGEPGSGFQIRVRGGSSINASNDPLYVVDGFALSGSSQDSGTGGSGLGNSSTSPLESLDPSSIESIEVLKDASATAIYGSRGANGVIIITTKKGKKGRTSLNFETFTGFSSMVRPIDLLSGEEYVNWWNEYFPTEGADPTDPNDRNAFIFKEDDGTPIPFNDSRMQAYDWQEEVTRNAVTNNYRLSMSGGSDKNSYSASFSYLDQEGIVKTNNYERYNGNINVRQNITEKLSSGININLGITKNSGIIAAANAGLQGRSGLLTNSALFRPIIGRRLDNGDAIYDDEGNLVSLRNGEFVNPVLRLETDYNNRRSSRVLGSVYVQYKITDNLTFKTSLRGSVANNKSEQYFSEEFGYGRLTNGRAIVNNRLTTSIITEQNLNYRKRFNGGHNLNLTAVFERQEDTNEFIRSEGLDFNLPGVNLGNLGVAGETLPNSSNFVRTSLQSYLGRLQYNYKGKYILNASARYDGSSRFAEGAKWGFFPSAGIAWNIANENFLKGSRVINNLKLKTSYGETGNTSIGSYRSFAQAQFASIILNGNQQFAGAAVSQLANPDLTWETTKQLDAGISLGLFNNRISLEADYYEKETEDLLLEVPLAASSGFNSVFKNLGAVENKGLEFALNTINIDTKNFEWTTNFNISFNRNKVLDLGDANEFIVTAIGAGNQVTNDYIVRVGESLGSFYGIEVEGVYNYSDFDAFDGLSNAEAAARLRQDAEDQGIQWYELEYELKNGVHTSGQSDRTRYRPGMPKFVDQPTVDTDGDGIPDAGDGVVNADDRTILGNALPDHFGGFTNNFKYKNVDLSIVTQWSYGNEINNKNLHKGYSQTVPFSNKYGIIRNRWEPESPNTRVASILGYQNGAIPGSLYSDYVEDGSFLRISNITLGYELPKRVKENLGVKTFRLYGAVDNVFVWTNYSGYDPEVSVARNQLTPGLDVDSYPRARTFRIGLNVGF